MVRWLRYGIVWYVVICCNGTTLHFLSYRTIPCPQKGSNAAGSSGGAL